MTAEDLRTRWQANEALRAEWRNIVQGHTWQIVMNLMREEAIAEARSASIETDLLIARKHREMEAALNVLKKLNDAHMDTPKPPDANDPLAEYEQKAREAYAPVEE